MCQLKLCANRIYMTIGCMSQELYVAIRSICQSDTCATQIHVPIRSMYHSDLCHRNYVSIKSMSQELCANQIYVLGTMYQSVMYESNLCAYQIYELITHVPITSMCQSDPCAYQIHVPIRSIHNQIHVPVRSMCHSDLCANPIHVPIRSMCQSDLSHRNCVPISYV